MKALILSFLGLILLANTGCRFAKNFHAVEPGVVYRSAQLTKEELEQAFSELGIQTVINLRGESPQQWFLDEQAAAEAYGVDLVSIKMSARRLPHKADIIKLLETLETAKRPILIHCLGGADRTGEASALYQMLYMNYSKKKALDSLMPKYFHIKSRMPAKRYFIKLFEGVDWVYSEYDPCSGKYKPKLYDILNPVCTGEKSDNEEWTDEDDT